VFLDYIICPGLLSVISAAAMNSLVPFIPRWIWILVFIAFGTSLTLVGINLTAHPRAMPRSYQTSIATALRNTRRMVERISYAASRMHRIAILRLSSLRLASARRGRVLAC
jgi:hypothetical protein